MATRQVGSELKGEAGKLRPMQGLQKTGYDELIEAKDRRIKEIVAFILKRQREDPKAVVTRAEIASRWGIGMRATSRYLADIRDRYKKGTVRTITDLEAEEKEANIVVMRRILKRDPGVCKNELGKLLGVSRVTLNNYLESPLVTDKERALFADALKFSKSYRQKRVDDLKALLAKDRTMSRGEMSRKLGISPKSLIKYLKEIEGW